ncbi:hypothetical protein NPIL_551021 [Nephila pilipes]|uniref:Uncharacterized protein n=1 Tax=Nephila pilipes TaxID=299642 RepID=A0A8X6MCC9_NEPPI|nr:hypothetical protein NPIL_551021 [Nephila pilipes]
MDQRKICVSVPKINIVNFLKVLDECGSIMQILMVGVTIQVTNGHIKVKMKNGECLPSVDRLILLELTIEPSIPDQRTGVRPGAGDSSSYVNSGSENFLQCL